MSYENYLLTPSCNETCASKLFRLKKMNSDESRQLEKRILHPCRRSRDLKTWYILQVGFRLRLAGCRLKLQLRKRWHGRNTLGRRLTLTINEAIYRLATIWPPCRSAHINRKAEPARSDERWVYSQALFKKHLEWRSSEFEITLWQRSCSWYFRLKA